MERPAGRGAAIAVLLVLACDAASAQTPTVTVVDNAFRITRHDGTVVAQRELPGTVIVLGDGTGTQRRLRIDGVEVDTRDPAGETILYALSEPDAADGSWHEACRPDPDGRRLGFPLPGAFTAEGRYDPSPDRILITCTGGAEGKCVRFGYKPWGRLPDGTSLLPYYQACVRLVRADYGGDGVGHTKDGTPIDLFDRVGIQRDEVAPGMTLEAAFNPEGAVCVAHTRLPDAPPLPALAGGVPRLAGHVGASCSETVPALLYVRSFKP